MNFSDYSKAKRVANDLSPESKKILDDFLKSYHGKSESDLIDEIIKTAVKSKKEGKLTDGDIDNFYKMIYPMLSGEQVKKLDEVVKMLKNNC
ncbi:MAG: hypothetical protein IJF75_02825 [Clostridia bacterium]|nr:hypothetical protein [Clostridia bacterium]